MMNRFGAAVLRNLLLVLYGLSALTKVEAVEETTQVNEVIEEAFVAEYDEADYKKQLYMTSYTVELGQDKEGNPIYYKVQDATDDYLYLGPNEVFFTPPLSYRLGGKISNPDIEFTRGVEYTHIKGLTREGSQLEWSFITTEGTNSKGECFLSGYKTGAGSILTIQVDEFQPIDIVLTKEMFNAGYFQFVLPQLTPGLHKLSLKSTKLNTSGIKIFNLRISGDAAQNARIVRERWRPEALWSKFKSSQNNKDVQSWIFELTTDDEFGFYGPISAPFGYYGPVFEPGGAVSGINMSLWSYSAKATPLPDEQKSHLLGIGSSRGVFSGWSHEGYGVKVRNWNPFANNTSKKYVLGLRYSEDGDFTTYYGYFWNERSNKWQLYSAGRKLKTRSIKSLVLNSFIEVTGGADKERSNHRARLLKYRGWVRDSEGNWSEIDRMYGPNKLELSNKKEGVTEDGKYFFASTGGLANQYPTAIGEMIEKPPAEELPNYMKPKKLRHFDRLPFVPVIHNVKEVSAEDLEVAFVMNTKLSSKVTVCWGKHNAQSTKLLWDHFQTFDIPSARRKKLHKVTIPKTEGARFFRILVQNSKAQMWNFDTYDLYPEPETETVEP